MNIKISTIEPDKQIVAPHSQEVEFALLLSQMINTVKEDPEQLRLTIYDFARAKLKNDMSWADEEERKRIAGALETAIIGVEQFSQRPAPPRQQQQLPAYGQQTAEAVSDANYAEAPPLRWVDAETVVRPAPKGRFGSGGRTTSRRAGILQNLAIFALILIIAGAVAIFYLQREALLRLRLPTQPETVSTSANTTQPPPSSAVATAAPAPPPFPLPSVYGVYALNKGVLSELDTLSAQVPDRRVAMSTPITSVSHTVLPEGETKFIVFRRDVASNAPEKVDVRVVAQVMRAISFGANGKRSITPVSDAWSIRNISRGFRVRPIPGNPEMVLIQPENADTSLAPGRYALALQGQAYDFTVAGQIKDVAQCLERTEAANGTFYSECQAIKP
jgi:hypothetical protein